MGTLTTLVVLVVTAILLIVSGCGNPASLNPDSSENESTRKVDNPFDSQSGDGGHKDPDDPDSLYQGSIHEIRPYSPDSSENESTRKVDNPFDFQSGDGGYKDPDDPDNNDDTLSEDNDKDNS